MIEPTCAACGKVMTPANARLRPEFFYCDACLPDEFRPSEAPAMPCPTCNHTMHNLGLERERKFWCPHCGTVKTESGDWSECSAPAVVGRLAYFLGHIHAVEPALTERTRHLLRDLRETVGVRLESDRPGEVQQ